ncbi:MAG: nucleotidyltransferase domain-containing protein [Ardenticatenaceae bacterium]|nr:nucleotidyltransferase domain-containing protein [Ardenticatenaceae bacterium]MCB8986314.1 nucleotidyltransferase domain-containing protein [Ardenticatenaceae bacterium]
MDAQIDSLVAQLVAKMGSRLTAVYLFGSYTQPYFQPGESDVNLLFVLADDADMQDLRDAFLPLWQQHGHWLRRGPWAARAGTLARFRRLNPHFAHHLSLHGRLLHTDLSFEPGPLPALDPHETLGHLATQALSASSALLPDLLGEATAVQRRAELRRLARQLWQKPIPEETAVRSYARVQHILGPKIAQLPAARAWNNTTIPAVTAPFLPGLQSLYQQGANIVMVLANLGPQAIRDTNWEQLKERLAQECEGLVVTTAVQLCLSLVYDNPIGLVLKNYQHSWGMNPVADLTTSRRQIMRQAATLPSGIEMIQLPAAYLTQDDDHLHNLIHDFQNRLLNIRLEHELLHRFGYTPSFIPPASLPERTAPLYQRVSAIFRNLAWWSDFYLDQMLQAEA